MKTSITDQNKGFAVLGLPTAQSKTLYTKTKNGYAIFSLENF
jgi:hypothetical protein